MGHGLQNIILGKVTRIKNIISGKVFRIYVRILNTPMMYLPIVIGYQHRGNIHRGTKTVCA